MQNDRIGIAAIQMEPQIGQREKNWVRIEALVREAAGRGARLMVLPELCTTGYIFQSRQEAFGLAQRIPDGEDTLRLAALARELDVYLCAGLLEADGPRCYNSAVLAGPEGVLGVHRKLNLWADDFQFFEPGNLGYQVFDTALGRIGMLICYDMWFPENFRMLTLLGADLILCPTNWLILAGHEKESMGRIMAMAAAGANHVFVAAASRIGVERGVTFCGGSTIAGPDGWCVCPSAAFDREETVLAQADLMESRRVNVNGHNAILRDRRTDLYGKFLGHLNK
ncbi:MAG: nitrilase family protein [Oscillibacter sp.]|jgi:predicted amidohydrolase|nr:nitrilase family protein [Oscillibacter sp.]